jgi:DNA-binding IclR family transcriptional regulator
MAGRKTAVPVAHNQASMRPPKDSRATPAKTAARRGGEEAPLERPMLLRSLKLLETVASAGRGLSLAQLATMLNVPKPTVFRLANRLEQSGYLIREPGKGGFAVGPRLMRLGLAAVRTSGSNAERHAILTALVTALGETCNFTTLAGGEVLYLDRVETRWPLRVHLEPGSRVPLHSTASGKLFLAHLPADRRRRLLESVPLTADTPSTLTSVERLEEECAAILRRGYSTDNEEFLLGLIAVAVPVLAPSGTMVAAIACHAPCARMPLRDAIARLPEIYEAARRIGATFPE